ncbi:hypothetical protein O0L34_g9361 [Tuta absoluta]|nr:hypothetical protein O0L34_g9361 [Tuta absoluta]
MIMKKYSTMEEIVNQVLENESPRNEVHGNELPDTPDSQPGGSQVTVMQEPRSQASAAVKFKHPVPMKKAKKSASQKDPILNEALQLMRSSAQAATANLASTTLSPGIGAALTEMNQVSADQWLTSIKPCPRFLSLRTLTDTSQLFLKMG